MRAHLFCTVVAFCASFPVSFVAGQELGGNTAEQWLEEYSHGWDESKWEQTFRRGRSGYMRPLSDHGWKVSMHALQGVVSRGDESIPALLVALKHEDVAQRVFAARALGYLAPNVPTDPLLEAAKDSDAAVRLYAVDALGMKGDTTVDFEAFMETERNGSRFPQLTPHGPRLSASHHAYLVRILVYSLMSYRRCSLALRA